MDNQRILQVCREVLDYAGDRDYEGYNKHDGIESPLTKALSFNLKWGRLFWTQVVMRSPVNLRPLLGVPRLRNPKGIALFAMACLDMHKVTGEEHYANEARLLLDWLVDHTSCGFDMPCWGYPYAWQDIGFFAPAGFPNRIVTYFVCSALLDGFEHLGEVRYMEAAHEATRFLLDTPRILFESADQLCMSYVPSDQVDWVVMDVSVLIAVVLARVGKHTGEERLGTQAKKLVHYVVDKQTPEGAWFYSHPPGDSHIGHDNYHTGEILDAIDDYRLITGDESYMEAHRLGLEFYAQHLFTAEGAPKWMSNKTFPHDVHGASQGIITFSRHPEYFALLDKTLNWTLDTLYSRKGYFYYQRRATYTKKFTLMRWCNGWMSHALALCLVRMQSSRQKSVPPVLG